MAAPRRRRRPLARTGIVLGVVAGALVAARSYRDRAVAANTLRDDHVLDPTKPFLGRAATPPSTSST